MFGPLSATGLLQNLRPLLNPPNGETPKTGLLVKDAATKGSSDPVSQTQESSSTLSSILVKNDIEINDDSGILANMAAGDLTVEIEEKKDSEEENDPKKSDENDQQGFIDLLFIVVYKHFFNIFFFFHFSLVFLSLFLIAFLFVVVFLFPHWFYISVSHFFVNFTTLLVKSFIFLLGILTFRFYCVLLLIEFFFQL